MIDQERNNEKVLITDTAIQREVIDNYLNDEKVAANLDKWAKVLLDRFRGNWFTVKQITKKTSAKDPAVAHDLVTLLTMKEMCIQKVDKGEVKYQIVTKPGQRLAALQEEWRYVNQRKLILEAEIKKVEDEIAQSEKK